MPGQSPDHILLLHEPTAESESPLYTYDPKRDSEDVVPEVYKTLISELRPTQEAPAGGRHRAPSSRRWWPFQRTPPGPPPTSSLAVLPAPQPFPQAG